MPCLWPNATRKRGFVSIPDREVRESRLRTAHRFKEQTPQSSRGLDMPCSLGASFLKTLGLGGSDDNDGGHKW